MHNPRKGKAFSTPYAVPDTGPIDPFDLFCACFMGLMPDGSYRGGGLGEAAKHLRRSPNELRQMLQDYGMDPESLSKVDFDLSLAKLDIQVAPEGIDRRELARGLFEEFCDLHPTLTPAAAPVATGGNGARPEPPAQAAPAPEREEAPVAEAAPEPERPQGAPDAEARAEAEPEDEGPAQGEVAEEELADDEPADDELDEEPVAVDAGVTRGAPVHGERQDRPVRQIRRSPTRRGR